MMKQNACPKGDRGLCIDLLITNSKFSFLETNSFDIGLRDHMIYTILKTNFEKFEARKSIYRNFEQYDSDQFQFDICSSISVMRTHAAFEHFFFNFR